MSFVKKVLVILLCMALFIPVFAACDRNEDTSNDGSEEQMSSGDDTTKSGETTKINGGNIGGNTGGNTGGSTGGNTGDTTSATTGGDESSDADESTTVPESSDPDESTGGDESTDSGSTGGGGSLIHQHTPNEEGICSDPECNELLQPSSLIQYENRGTYAEVVGYTGSATKLMIASTYEDLPVTGIAASAFKNKTSLVNVIIPNSIKSIGIEAFEGCTNLVRVQISRSLETIGDRAFKDCTSLDVVFHIGTEQGWGRIIIGEGNECLTSARRTYSDETPFV